LRHPRPDSFQIRLYQTLQFTAAVPSQHRRLGTCLQEPLEHVTRQGRAFRSSLRTEATLLWQLRDCSKADHMHKGVFPSISSSAAVETSLKDIAGAALCLVNLHLSVLCSTACYTLAAEFLQVSHQAVQKKAVSTHSRRHKYYHE